MKKTLAFALALATAFISQTPLLSQGVVKKVEDKASGAAKATGNAAEKVGSKTKETAKDAADATVKETKKAASATEKETKKVGEKTKDATVDAAKATEKETKKVVDSKPAQETGKAAKTVGTKTADAAKTVGSKVKEAVTPAPTEKDIAEAQAKGRVWVNTDSGVYHKSGQFYGKTHQGKFMTEAAAKKAGYRPAQ
jgi:hypothetical protein